MKNEPFKDTFRRQFDEFKSTVSDILSDFDYFTSDNDFGFDETDAYNDDALCPYALEADWIHTYGNVGHKLDKFMNMPNSFKKFDPENCHPDVQNRYHWGDPLHHRPHWAGYRKVHNLIFGIIHKNKQKHVHEIVDLIKNRIEYKTNAVYRSVAKYIIRTLLEPQCDDGWNILPYEITECGHLYIRKNKVEYYFPHEAYEEYKEKTIRRIKDSLTCYKGVSVFMNDDFESLVVVNHKAGKRKNKHKIYMKSMFEMFNHKDQIEWVHEIRDLIAGE